MRTAIIEAVKTYAVMTALTFVPMVLGWFISKFSDGEVDEKGENLIDEIALGLEIIGIMFGMFWLIYTFYWVYYFVVSKPLTPDRIQEILQALKNK